MNILNHVLTYMTCVFLKRLLIFDQKRVLKKLKKKNEFTILRQTDVQRKMNARGSFETEYFFF